MTHLASTVRTARTPKWCRACLGDILPGQRYNDDRFAFDGRAYAWPSHPFCLWLVERLELWDPWDHTTAEGAVTDWRRDITQPADDPLHQFAAVLSWWAEWRMA